MSADIHWSVWLLAGSATGLIPLFGESRLLGLVQLGAFIGAPFVILNQSGTGYLPFVLFYGALMLVSSIVYKRKTAREDRQRKEAFAAKKKRWG